MENNFQSMLNNSIIAVKSSWKIKDSKSMITYAKKVFEENKDLITEANRIDIKNNNGEEIDFNRIYKIFNEILMEDSLVEEKELSKITEDNLLYSKLYTSRGLISVIFEGDMYSLLYTILLALKTHNAVIFSQEKYNYGVNNFIVQIFQSVMEKFNYNKNIFQIYFGEIKEIFDNFVSIDFTVLLGSKEFQNKYIKKSGTQTICSGYRNYDMYIEDVTHRDVIDKIVKENEKLNLYIKNGIDYKHDEGFYVSDAEEAVFQMKCNGSGYCAAIFTSNTQSAQEFIEYMRFSNVYVNMSPYIADSFDLNQKDFLKEKLIAMPQPYKFENPKAK